MNIKLIDTHFHLDHYKNHKEIYESINKLEQYTLCMTNSPGIFVSCKNLYKESKYIKFALGFHPHERNLSSKDFSDFLILARNSIYIGEVGLDFSSNKYISYEQQLKYFEQIVKLCSKENKLMSVHLRKSEDAAINILKKYNPKKCIIHWFNGSQTQLDNLIKLGCYFSLNTNMIKSKRFKNQITHIPINKILVESDGPYTKVINKKYYPDLLAQAYQIINEDLTNVNLNNQVFRNFKELLQK